MNDVDAAKRLADLSREQRAQLFQRLQQKKARPPEGPPLQRQPRDTDRLPLSFAQQRLWVLDQIDPGSPLYNIPELYWIRGNLDAVTLWHALGAVVARHETLRTTFVTEDGQPWQVIGPATPSDLPLVDLRGHPQADRVAEALRLAHAEVRRPFDLMHGPLMRSLLIRLEAGVHLLVLTIHHIAADGWSLGVFIRELAMFYEALPYAKQPPLAELPIQYVDFAIWQRQHLQGEVLERHLSYWRRQLADLPVLQLPTDRPRPPVQTHRGAIYRLSLAARLSEGLRALSQQEGCSLFITMLAGLKLLLARYTGQLDIPVGTIIANRNRFEIEELIGFFVNTLVLRSDLSGNPSFRNVVRRVRDVALDAYSYQDLPFEQLVEQLQPVRDPSRAPLFQVLFTVQNAPMGAPQVAGMTFTRQSLTTDTAKFDLAVFVEETTQGLALEVEYATDLFDESTIDRLLGHYHRLLDAAVADPGLVIADLPLITETERHKALIEWNTPAAIPFPASCFPRMFEARAARTPNALAVTYEDQQLNYGQLNARANQLARYLRRLGVGPEVLVGLCLERSPDMLVGLLGILKAGGAYIPLDPAYPAERLAYMLEDTRAPVLITQAALAERFSTTGARLVALDSDWPTIAREPAENLAHQIAPDQLAYVIYTSGSTGRPKGVMVSHAALANFLYAMREQPGITARDTLLAVTTLAFDIAGLELYLPLSTGAQVVLVSREVAADGLRLAEALQTSHATIMQATPATWRLLLAAGWPGDPHLTILCGGEALPQPLAQTLVERSASVWNMYGPTEATIWATVWRVGAGPIVIGRPIDNLQTYVLDPWLEPAPVGTVGELYIGGSGLARGYVQRPDLTAERFVPNPFAAPHHEMWVFQHEEHEGLVKHTTPGQSAMNGHRVPTNHAASSQAPSLTPLASRLYRTGDLARYLPDGTIECLGRVDQQVKLRGFRIELSEIESVLGRHAAIGACAVLIREDTPGDHRLVAYYVPSGDELPTTDELRRFLQRSLPDYMLPAVFMQLTELPLTANGKIDRRGLPAPSGVRPELDNAYVAPRTDTEQKLALIWAQLLGLEQVGIHDNFFALGGDSLLNFRMVARARDMGIALTPKLIFQHQTIAELVVAAGARQIRAEQGLVTGTSRLTPVEHWFLEQSYNYHDRFSIGTVLEAPDWLPFEQWQTIIQALLQHHDALRFRLVRGQEGPQLRYGAADGPVPLQRIDSTRIADALLPRLFADVTKEQQQRFRMSEGPLATAVLFDCGAKRSSYLLLVCHHLVADAFSWQILLADLDRIYQQVCENQPIALPAKTTEFAYWAGHLNEQAQSAAIQAEQSYWFADARMQVPPLPLDHPNGANTFESADYVIVPLSTAATQALLRDIPKGGEAQIDELLMGALAHALGQWSDTPLLLIDQLGHGRTPLMLEDEIDLSRTVGWLSVLFPAFVELNRTGTAWESVQAVSTSLHNTPNRGMGYGILRYLSSDPALRQRVQAAPRAQILFNYLGELYHGLGKLKVISGGGRPMFDPKGIRPHVLVVNVVLNDNQLQLLFEFSRNLHQRATITRLATQTIEALQAIITHSQGTSPDMGSALAHLQEGRRASRQSARKLEGTMEQQPTTTAPGQASGMSAFMTIWFGQLVSLLGSAITGFALAIWMYQRTGSATALTLIAFCGMLPIVLFSPLAGVLVDRWDRRWALIVSDIGTALTPLLLLIMGDQVPLWLLYLIVFISGIFRAFQFPALSAATTLLVPKEQYGRASGLTQLAQGVAQLLAPILAAVLIGIIGIGGIYLFDIVTFMISIATLLAIRIPKPEVSEAGKQGQGSMLSEMLYGWSYILARRGLLTLLVFFAISNFLVSAVVELANPMLLSFTSPAVMGTVLSVAGVGILAGSVLMGIWGGPRRRIHGVLGSMLLSGVCMIIAGLAPSAWLIGIAAFFFTLSFPITNACSQAIWQNKIPADIQGRVFATRGAIATAAIPLAYLISGPLADYVFQPLMQPDGLLAGSIGLLIGVGPGRGIALMFIVLGLLSLLLVVGGWLYPQLWRLEDELPDTDAADAANEPELAGA